MITYTLGQINLIKGYSKHNFIFKNPQKRKRRISEKLLTIYAIFLEKIREKIYLVTACSFIIRNTNHTQIDSHEDCVSFLSNFYVSLLGREAKLLGVITCLSIMHALTFFADKNEQARPSIVCRVAKVFSFTNPILQLNATAHRHANSRKEG